MIDRKLAPNYKIPEKINYLPPEKLIMPNNTGLYVISAGSQNVMRFVLVFSAGTRYQLQSFIAAATANMLNEGTIQNNASEIAELFDFYGSSFEVSIDRDWTILSVYCLTKHAPQILQLLESLVKHPVFPSNELSIYKDKHKQSLKMEEEKVAFLARREFLVSLYGRNHPYGGYGVLTDYDLITTEMLQSFHQSNFTSNNVFMLLVGKVGDTELKLVEKHFGTDSWGQNNLQTDRWFEPKSTEVSELFINKTDALQSAIKYGKVLFTKSHPDYIGTQVLNTVLGGYFGSRLMQNIREDKGYTYGIYSGIIPQQSSGYFTISTETGAEYTQQVITEIKYEMNRLCNDLIPVHELDLVKHYIFGEMLRTLDGPWGQAEVCIDSLQLELPLNYVNLFFNEVRDITPQQLQNLAQRYFNPETMHLVIAGKQ